MLLAEVLIFSGLLMVTWGQWPRFQREASDPWERYRLPWMPQPYAGSRDANQTQPWGVTRPPTAKLPPPRKRLRKVVLKGF